MFVKGIQHILIQAKDFEKSLTFYQALLGKPELVARKKDESHAVFQQGSFKLILHSTFDNFLDQIKPRGAGIEMQLQVSDVDGFYKHCVGQGLTGEHQPENRGTVRLFHVHDPDGYEWEFAQNIE
ncbi:MAG: VOC family protein [Oligoflexales bacterium]